MGEIIKSIGLLRHGVWGGYKAYIVITTWGFFLPAGGGFPANVKLLNKVWFEELFVIGFDWTHFLFPFPLKYFELSIFYCGITRFSPKNKSIFVLSLLVRV